MKKEFRALYIEFSFLPQVVAAALIYGGIRFDSAVLLNRSLRAAFFAAFLEIVVFAFLTIPKRFIFTRFLLMAAYIQLILTVTLSKFYWRRLVFGSYRGLNPLLFGFCAFGIVLAVLNVIALIKYKKGAL